MVIGLPGYIASFLWLLIAFSAAVYAARAWQYNRSAVIYILPLCFSSILVAIASYFYFATLGDWASLILGALIFTFLVLPSTIRNFTALLRVYKSSKEKDSRWESMSSQAFEGIYLVHPETFQYLDVNPSGCAGLGYTLDELKALTVEQIHPDSHPLVKRQIGEVASTGKPKQFQVWASQKGGKRIYVDLTLSTFTRDGQKVILATGRDLTRWILKNEQISHLNRLYEILTLSNRAIAQMKHRDELVERIAQLITEEGGYKLAWVACLEGARIHPEFIAGAARRYVEGLDLSLDNPDMAQSPVVRAFKEKHIVCINSIQSNVHFKHYAERAAHIGVNSIAALPVIVAGKVERVLAIYSEKEFAFDDKTRDLLTNLAEDLSRALVNIVIEQQRAQNANQLRKLSSAVDQSADAIMILSADGDIEYINPKFERLTGYLSSEVLGRRPTLLCFDDAEAHRYEQVLTDLKNGRQWKGEVHYRRKDGSDYWSKDVVSPIRSNEGVIINFVSTSEDWTALREAQRRISELAFYDPVTGLPNKRLVLDRVRQYIKASFGEIWNVAVFFVDLDRFKVINDSMGHQAGDTVLKQIAGRFQSVVGGDDTVARLGADEFVVVMSKVTHVREIVQLGELLMEVLAAPIAIGNTNVSLTASAGVTIAPSDGTDADDLLRKADLAMYHAKSTGRNQFQFYMDEMNAKAVGQMDLERRLRAAVNEEQFEVYYQPQIDLSTGELEGVEALLRWPTPAGMVSPGEFIPVAEEIGFMPQLGEWVLSKACQDIRALNGELGLAIKVAVNLSASQFKESDCLVEQVTNALKLSSLSASLLEIEITESMLIDSITEATATLAELRSVGVQLAIDDFGTGYSSLSYLSRLPVDTLKIDRSFVQDLETNDENGVIITTIIALGHQLNKRVLAEGIETKVQLEKLRQWKCDSYQGFYFAKPLPLPDLRKLLLETQKQLVNH